LADIRVDQSHCNYYLAKWLEEHGWTVYFLDAGRVSRGGSGTQGQFLRVFESNGFPIPDIACAKDDVLLIIEIDNNFRKAKPSLLEYDRVQGTLLRLLGDAAGGRAFRLCLLGYCRTGLSKSTAAVWQEAQLHGVVIQAAFVLTAPRTVEADIMI
jgi:hypothetical protein